MVPSQDQNDILFNIICFKKHLPVSQLTCSIQQITVKYQFYIIAMIENLKAFLQLSPDDLKQNTILKQKGDVFYLLLNTKANTLTKKFVRQIHAQLDQVQAHDGPTALVTASLSKLFSGGIDLKEASHLQPEDQRYAVLEYIGLFGRISALPFPTFCLVRGGAVAGGCMLAFSYDYVYVGGKGKFSTNEANLQMHFPPGMLAVIKKRHPFPAGLRDMIIFSREFSAEEALQYKFIDGILKEEEAVTFIHQKASDLSYLGQNKQNMGRIKSELHKEVLQSCFRQQIHGNYSGYVRMNQMPKL